jgi:hypothetical protein
LVIGYWLLVIGYWLLVINYWFSRVSGEIPPKTVKNLVVGRKFEKRLKAIAIVILNKNRDSRPQIKIWGTNAAKSAFTD